jgi:hypothetical protein
MNTGFAARWTSSQSEVARAIASAAYPKIIFCRVRVDV